MDSTHTRRNSMKIDLIIWNGFIALLTVRHITMQPIHNCNANNSFYLEYRKCNFEKASLGVHSQKWWEVARKLVIIQLLTVGNTKLSNHELQVTICHLHIQ